MKSGLNDFWRDVMELQEPPYREPIDDEVLHLQDQVAEAARDLARAISTRESVYRADGQEAPDGIALSPDWQLAYLYALHEIEGIARRLADGAARTAGGTGASYAQLGAAWGITKQAARLRWPGAVRKPDDTSGEGEPFELWLSGGLAEIIQLPNEGGFIWKATGGNGTSGQAEEPYGNRTEAAAHAGAFLARHAAADDDPYGPDAAHAGCVEPHLGPEGYVDCDGTPR
ncbi:MULTISPECIES: hypothetical protein [unclassified Streptomyces]|uniref:hypothetical protein n=1 Tax=unclassified Streptomyces TaxID=2593676 RepID=UPI00224DE4D0|nr:MULTISPECIES: hypothetical protein [unclassified Streptomyces]MCX4403802.1 hypothetical protein [Streptomyces sp. NBC_01764]MCX5181247.1 hypothetical protein [Streptomyces sp. NBC_00268]